MRVTSFVIMTSGGGEDYIVPRCADHHVRLVVLHLL